MTEPSMPTTRTAGWRTSPARPHWSGYGRATRRPSASSPRATGSTGCERRSGRCSTPRTASRTWPGAVSCSTTSGRTRRTRAACGGAPRWSATARAAARLGGAAGRGRPGRGGGRELGVAGRDGAAAGLPDRPGRAVPGWRGRDGGARVRPGASGGSSRTASCCRRPRAGSAGSTATGSTSARTSGPDSLTSSGYPRVIKEWRRGTPLGEATVVYEGKPDDVSAFASHDPTPGFERDFVGRSHRLLPHRDLPAPGRTANWSGWTCRTTPRPTCTASGC